MDGGRAAQAAMELGTVRLLKFVRDFYVAHIVQMVELGQFESEDAMIHCKLFTTIICFVSISLFLHALAHMRTCMLQMSWVRCHGWFLWFATSRESQAGHHPW